jgi:hypothetical protein
MKPLFAAATVALVAALPAHATSLVEVTAAQGVHSSLTAGASGGTSTARAVRATVGRHLAKQGGAWAQATAGKSCARRGGGESTWASGGTKRTATRSTTWAKAGEGGARRSGANGWATGRSREGSGWIQGGKKPRGR